MFVKNDDEKDAPSVPTENTCPSSKRLTIEGLLPRASIDCTFRVSLERARCSLAFTVPTGRPKIRAASWLATPAYETCGELVCRGEPIDQEP